MLKKITRYRAIDMLLHKNGKENDKVYFKISNEYKRASDYRWTFGKDGGSGLTHFVNAQFYEEIEE